MGDCLRCGKKYPEMERNKKHNIKETLLKQGVEKPKRVGFVNVNKKNIIRDKVYNLYFLKILNEISGKIQKRILPLKNH